MEVKKRMKRRPREAKVRGHRAQGPQLQQHQWIPQTATPPVQPLSTAANQLSPANRSIKTLPISSIALQMESIHETKLKCIDSKKRTLPKPAEVRWRP